MLRAVLIEQRFSKFYSFFKEKQGKQETFLKYANLAEGKVFGRLRIPIIGRKNMENMEIQKVARRKNQEI